MGKSFMEHFVLEDIKIPPTPEGPGEDGNGVNAFIYRGEKMAEIENSFGRKDCCLKIFKNREPFSNKPWWGSSARAKGSLLSEATHIQNIYARYALAPRVYAIFTVKIGSEKYWAQLLDDLGHCEPNGILQNQLITGPMLDVAKDYDIEIFNDGREWNVVGEKYVDFQGFHLKDDYKNHLKRRIFGVASVGRWGNWENYQSIPSIDIRGGRNTKHRIENLGLKDIDFKGKTVLDIGCSEGVFTRYAERRGAKRTIGIDLPGVTQNLWELSSFLGSYNSDYYGFDLKEEDPSWLGEFDIVLYLSMCQHIGFPDWVKKMTKSLLVFEGNAKGEDAPTLTKIRQQFTMCEEKGRTNDLLDRPVIWARV